MFVDLATGRENPMWRPLLPADGTIQPPEPYHGMWTAIGISLLVCAAAWVVVVLFVTRRTRTPVAAEPSPQWRAMALRHDYLRAIDEVVERNRAGELAGRASSQQLSALVRGFVLEVSGQSVNTMTLTELANAQSPSLRRVGELVLHLYPGEFGPNPEQSVEQQADHARAVVAQWI